MEERKISGNERLSRISFLCLCAFLLDCCCTGSGHWFDFQGVSPRLLLAFLTVLFALPAFWADREKQLKNPLNWMVLAFLLYTGVEALRGRENGNNPAVLASDVKGFIYLVLIPVLQVTVKDDKAFRRVADCVIAGCTLQAGLIFLLNILFAGIRPDFYEPVVEVIWDCSWGTILPCEYNAYRIFCKSSIFLIAACAILLGRIAKAEKMPIGYSVLFLLDAEALMLTYTRSIYLTTLAVFILAFVLLLWTRDNKKQMILRTLLLLAIFLVMTVTLELLLKQGIFQYAFARCFHWDLDKHLSLPHTWTEGHVNFEEITENTNNTRALTVGGLKDIIRQYPVFGKGLGATPAGRDGIDEYFYLDILARMGAVGLILYILPCICAAARLIPCRRILKTKEEQGLMLCGLIGFLIATYFNPWMNAALGISWYAVCLAAVSNMTLKGE